MAGGYDGTIRINTEIDSKSVAKGTKSISSSLSGVLRSLKFVGAAMGVAFSGAAIFSFIKNAMSQFDLMSSSVGGNIKAVQNSFKTLQGAIASVGTTLLIQLTPYIITAITWLTGLVNILAQVISALFGVEAGMGAVADSTADASKKAKGSLANFDQLNVLNKDSNAANGSPILPGVIVPPEILAQVEEFKTKLLDFLQPVIDALGRLKEALTPLGETIWAGLKWAWDNILVPLGTWVITDVLPAFLDLLGEAAGVLNEALIALQPLGIWLWENFLKPLGEWTGEAIIKALDWITARLEDLAAWIKDNPKKFQDFVAIIAILATVFEIAKWAIAAFAIVVTGSVLSIIALIAALGVMIYLLITRWDELKTTVKQIIFIIVVAIQSVKAVIMEAFGTALDFVQDKFTTVFEGIRSFVKGIINGIIGFINGMIDGVIGGINSIVGAANLIGNIVPGYSSIPFLDSPQIPQLATGAVIPPNAKFAAILGDQKSGMNIEAPESLIRQIVSEEMGKIEANIKIEFGGSLGALVRELKPIIDKENVRVGGSLIKSGVTV